MLETGSSNSIATVSQALVAFKLPNSRRNVVFKRNVEKENPPTAQFAFLRQRDTVIKQIPFVPFSLGGAPCLQ